MPQRAPYGSWKSPITASLITANQISLSEPRFSANHLYWLEGRPLERGRVVVACYSGDGVITDMIPSPFNARTRVHEYGGGAYTVHQDTLFFSDDASQRLFRKEPDGDARPITPDPGEPSSVRYADGVVTPDGRWILCVRETHHPDKEATNDLALLSADGSLAPQQIAGGSDFYSFPRLNREGTQLVWTSWDHPADALGTVLIFGSPTLPLDLSWAHHGASRVGLRNPFSSRNGGPTARSTLFPIVPAGGICTQTAMVRSRLSFR